MYPVRLVGEERIAIGDGVFIGSGSWLQTLPDGERIGSDLDRKRYQYRRRLCHICGQECVIEDDVLVARNVYISDTFTSTRRPTPQYSGKGWTR